MVDFRYTGYWVCFECVRNGGLSMFADLLRLLLDPGNPELGATAMPPGRVSGFSW